MVNVYLAMGTKGCPCVKVRLNFGTILDLESLERDEEKPDSNLKVFCGKSICWRSEPRNATKIIPRNRPHTRDLLGRGVGCKRWPLSGDGKKEAN